MKAILFFVVAGAVLDSHKKLATALATRSGEKVVFRNSSLVDEEARPESCLGVAGTAPESYTSRFPFWGKEGELEKPKAPDAVEEGEEATEEPPAPLNALGLPEGSPADRDALKEALSDAGVEFHPNTGTEKLADLYRAEVLETEPGE